VQREFSAGGVVLREEAGRTEVVVVHPREGVTALPKGHPDGDETLEQAATREVREEAGVDARPVERLGDVKYWYMLHGERVLKTVTFFRFEYLSGSTDDHDDEVVSAGWIPLADAPGALSYRGERAMAEKAVEALGQ
jgi:8-oxo-dGTP pyrophosphatase MutT (NUDIX family)